MFLSVIQPVVTKPANQTDVNRFAREVMRPNLLSFGGLHPDCDHVIEEIEKLKDMGMAGIKLPSAVSAGGSDGGAVSGYVAPH